MSLKIWHLIVFALFCIVYLAFAAPAQAAVRVWDGGGSTNNWSEAANWSSDTVPGSGDVATFDGTSTKNSTIDASFAGVVNGLHLNSGYTGTITQARAIGFLGGTYDQADGTFIGSSDTFDLQGGFNLTGGTFTAPTGTFNIYGSYSWTGGTFSGTGSTMYFLGCGGSVTFTYGGDFNAASGGNVALGKACNGGFTLVAGTTLLASTINDTGITVQAGAFLTTTGNFYANSFNNLGSFIAGAGTCRWYGSAVFNGTVNNLNACTSMQVDSSLTISSGITLTLNPAVTTIAIAGNYSNSGTFNISGRTLNFFGCGGSSQIIYNGNFNVDTGANVVLGKSCNGGFTVTSGQTLLVSTTNDTGITIQAGATLTTTGDFYANTLTNSGSLTIGSGTCRWYGSVTFGGTLNDISGCTSVQIDSSLTINSLTTLTTNPALTTISIAGNYVNNGTFNISGKTLNFFGCGGSSQITYTGNFNADTGASVIIGKACNGLFTIPTGQTLAASTVNDSFITIQAGASLTTTGNFYANYLSNLGSLVVGTGTCLFYGTATFNGTTNDLGGCTSLQVNVNLVVSPTRTLTLNPVVTTISIAGNYDNGGTFNISGRTLNFFGCGGSSQIVYSGNFNVATGASVTLGKSCNGTFIVPTGQALAASTINDTGLQVQSGATLNVVGNLQLSTLTNLGNFTTDSGTCFWYNSATFGGPINDLTRCTSITFNGSVTVSSGQTLSLGAAPISILGNFTNNGTVSAPSTPVMTFNGNFSASVLTDTSGTPLPLSIVLDKQVASSFTIGSTVIIGGSFTRNAVPFLNPSSPYSLKVQGDFLVLGTDAFGGSNLTIELNGSGTQNFSSAEHDLTATFVVNKTSGIAQLNGSATFSSLPCTVAVGTFYLNGQSFSCLSGFTVNNGATLELQGGEVTTTPTLNSGSTVLYVGDGDGLPDTFGIKGFTYSNLTINPTDANDTFGPTGASPLSSGLVAYYPFNEGAGGTTADGSGNGYTGTLNNMEAGDWSVDVPSSTFPNSYSLDLDGTNENIDLGNPSLLPAGANPRTICAWAKTNTTIGNSWAVSYGTSNPAQPFTVGRSGTSIYGTAYFNDLSSPNFWSTGVWQHECFVYTGTRERLYGNGALLAAGNFTLNTTRLKAKIGSYIENSEYWNGKIDEVRFYNRVLTTAEISALAAGDNLSPSTITDLTINGNLTLAAGNLTLPTGVTTVNGSLVKSGGVVNPNGGTVNLGGGDTVMSGAWSFAALTKTVTSGQTLTMPAGTTVSVTGALTLQGMSGNLLALRSSSSGVQANINSSGSRTLAYLDVKDNHGTNASKLTCGLTCVNSGNNTNWIFGPGVTLSNISGDTTEAGGTATFTAVLDIQPTSNVTIPLSSSDTSEGTISPASLVFTNANWNTPQTVTLTGVDDLVADGNIVYSARLGVITSLDVTYGGLDPSDVSVTNLDDDSSGIIVSSISGNTTEAGATATFSVVLNSQPAADVSIGISSSDTSEGTVSSSALVFTSANWNTPQVITVTGVDDFLDDGDIGYSILTAAASSADTFYDGINPLDLSLSNIDNDTFGVTVSSISGHTTEAGGIATFTVTLNSEPTANVTVAVTSDDVTEGTVPLLPSPFLTFTPGNWSTPHSVTVTGVDDFVDDGDVTYHVILAAAVSTDVQYSGLDAPDVTVINDDNETIAVTPSVISGNTTEAGGTATFTVVLGTQPTADVTVPITSSDLTEGTVNLSSLTFTSGNWSVPQTVTVTGVDDATDDGDVTYSVILGAVTSVDGDYNSINPADVSVTNLDDDTIGVSVSGISGNTTELGATATFTVVLTSRPNADVSIPVTSSDVTEGTVSAANLTFTSGNWNTPQTVTVTGVDDFVDDGDILYTITLAVATSADLGYNGFNPSDVSTTNIDNDVAGINVSAISGNTTELGGTASFTVALNSEPTASVTIGLSSSDSSEGTITVSSLTFTNLDWNVPQTVTVTGVDDLLNDGDILYSIITAPATSTDPLYNGLNAADAGVTNVDNENAGYNVSAVSGHTSEAGGTASFTVDLLTQPLANVTISVTTGDATEGTVSPSSLTFTNVNWNVPQTVNITGVDDAVDDDAVSYSIILGPGASADLDYNGLDPADVTVINDDNDIAGYQVSAMSGNTSEAGATATFTVVLLTQPTASVLIPVASSDSTEGTVSTGSLTFTVGNWSVPQTVTVTGVNDAIDDGDVAYSILLGAATSVDPKYNTLDPNDPSLVNLDNDVAGISVTESGGSTNISESGTSDSYEIVLLSQPTASVTVTMFADSQVEVDTPSVIFTSLNWNVPRTVTVSAVNDTVVEGLHVGTVSHGVSSADLIYNGMMIPSVTATITDDDSIGGSSGYTPPENVLHPPRIVVRAPMEADNLIGGQPYLITWSVLGDNTDFADLYYSFDGGQNYSLIAKSVANIGQYLWMIPKIATDRGLIKVVATDLASDVTDDASGLFTVQLLPEDSSDNRPLPTVGLSPVTGQPETITPVAYGYYVRSPHYSTVYFVEHGLIRRPFMDVQTFHTYERSFANVRLVTDATLAVLPLGPPMTPKPHTVLVKITSSPQVYAIGLGNLLRSVSDETTAAKLFGADWADYVLDLPPTSMTEFLVGAPMVGNENIDRTVLLKRVDLQ